MSELVVWLRGVLDGDELTAMAAGDRAWTLRVAEGGYPQQVYAEGNAALVCETYDGPTDNTGLKRSPTTGQHIALHDPADVRARVAADRALIDLHGRIPIESWDLDGTERDDVFCDACDGDGYPCKTLRILASGYSRRPGYDERWKP